MIVKTMSNHSDLSLLTVSSGLIDPNLLNIGKKLRVNKLSREASPTPIAFDVHRRCGKFIQRSFSTSDITNRTIEIINSRSCYEAVPIRHTVSELALGSLLYMQDSTRLSRSCSTWVAVGELDTSSTSQLPSPHAHCSSSLTMTSSQQQLSAPNFFVQINSIPQPSYSVNKNVRETYIRNRLLTTHRAIERLSQSEFNLDQLATLATATITVSEGSSGPVDTVQLIIPEQAQQDPDNIPTEPSSKTQKSKYKLIGAASMSRNLTIQDIEKERGKPLTKYHRNYMIFNWLHSLDQTSKVEDSSL